jgi:methyl-accepting chemotaxis protein
MLRYLSRFCLLHQFILLASVFALVSGLGAGVMWAKLDAVRQINQDIIERRFPSRLALGEAKVSAAGFATLAYRAQTADASQLNEIRQALSEEEARFTHWLQNVAVDDPQASEDLSGIQLRYDRMIAFLRHFFSDASQSDAEPRAFQVEYRFLPLRDDLDASLNHLSNFMGGATQDEIDLKERVRSVDLVITAEVIAASYATIGFCTSLWAAFGVAQPFRRLADATTAIVAGHVDVELPKAAYTEEGRTMSLALDVFRKNILFTRKLEEEHRKAKVERESALVAERRRVAEIFRKDVMDAVMIVSGAIHELQKNASFMRDRAIETDRQAQTVVKMSSEAIETIGSLSRSSTELTATAGSLNDHLFDAAKLGMLAMSDGLSTSERAEQLAEAVEAVTKIADFISDVAYKTNLLALNATIEAARCGEMGRGFAVVAGEVKHLAKATAGAAADIGRQLAAVRSAASQVVGAVKVTLGGLGQISAMGDALEEAYSQQEIASRTITGCVDSVVQNAQQVSDVILGVGLSTGETQQVAKAMLVATEELSMQAERLLSRSHEFCEKIALSDAA